MRPNVPEILQLDFGPRIEDSNPPPVAEIRRWGSSRRIPATIVFIDTQVLSLVEKVIPHCRKVFYNVKHQCEPFFFTGTKTIPPLMFSNHGIVIDKKGNHHLLSGMNNCRGFLDGDVRTGSLGRNLAASLKMVRTGPS